MDPLQTIHQVVEELDGGERSRLLYFCQSPQTDTSAEALKEILGRVLLHDPGQLMLRELLVRLRRFDILKKVCQTSRDEAERILSVRHFVPSFRVLMANISQALSSENLENIKFLLSTTLPREKLGKSKSFLDVVTELEKLDKVSPQRVDLMEECLRSIGRVDLAKKVAAYRNPAATPGQNSQQQRPRAPGPCLAASSQPHATGREGYGGVRRHYPPVCKQHMKVTETIPVPAFGSQSSQNPLDSYRMTSNPRGVCLIIDCVGADGDLLEQTFRALHFSVVVHRWLRGFEILTTLKETMRQRECTEADVFACCIISRGTSNHLLGTDSHNRGLHVNSIRRQFAANECLALAGKPRLLFLHKYSVADFQMHSGREHRDEDLETDGLSGAAMDGLIPENADTFWSHCWTDGHQLEKGNHCSVYVRALADALLKGHRRKLHLNELHMEVNRVVFEHNSRHPEEEYDIEVSHTLRKNLYL